MTGRDAALLFGLFLVWPLALVDDSGPTMADSTLLAAIRLVDHGTWTLSDESDPKLVFQTLAHDISEVDGRIYSGVGPGATVVAAPLYAALAPLLRDADPRSVTNRRITNYYTLNARGLGGAPPSHFASLYWLQIAATWLVVAPLLASLWLRLYRLLLECGARPAPALASCLAAAFGSMALYYGSMYSRQALGYALAWHAVLWLVGPRPPDRWRAAAAGLLLGAAVTVEYPSAMLVAAVLPLRWRALPRDRRVALAAALACVLALLAWYQHALFGSVLATPYHHRYWYTAPLLAERGIALEAFQPAATLGLGWPSPSVALQLCFGAFKGLFVYSPVLLLGLVGHLVAWRRGQDVGLHALSLGVFALFLVYNASLGSHVAEYGQHFWGGLSTLWGPRYLFAVLPWLAWGLVALDWRRPALRALVGVALAVSCANNLLGAMYSHVMMSTFAFGEELQQPLGYAWSLLLERGPRLSLLDARGVAPAVQAGVVLVLLAGSVFALHRLLRSGARDVARG